jgi:hypothetical protein
MRSLTISPHLETTVAWRRVYSRSHSSKSHVIPTGHAVRVCGAWRTTKLVLFLSTIIPPSQCLNSLFHYLFYCCILYSLSLLLPFIEGDHCSYSVCTLPPKSILEFGSEEGNRTTLGKPHSYLSHGIKNATRSPFPSPTPV